MKNALVILLLLLGNIIVLSQDKTIIKSETNISSPNYSESLSYHPWITVDPEKDNTKKKEKIEDGQNTYLTKQETEYYVELPVYVSDSKNIPIRGLSKNQFTLFVNDIEQEVETVKSYEPENNKLILIVDVSNSTSPNNLKDLQDFGNNFIKRLPAGNQVKIISFDEKRKILSDFTSDKLQLSKALRKLKYGGGTSLYELVQYIAEIEDSKNVRVVLLTDGVDTTSRKADFKSSIAAIKKSKLTVFPFYIDTFNNILSPKPSPKYKNSTLPPALISILGGVIRGKPQDVEETRKDYEFGKYYLTDLAKISAGRLLFAENLKTLGDKDFSYLTSLLEPQYYLSFRIKLSDSQDKNCRIKIRINQANLNIGTKGLIDLEGYKTL